jgi:retron-type reverse transcriptase
VIIPIFERSYIHDTYANRVNFGTHRALRRFTKFARSSRYVLQCDLQKYFPSIDHEILKQKIRHKIKCADTLWLIDKIIDNSNDQISVLEYFPGDSLLTPIERRRGLPIGNLTSQFLSNVYLNHFDHFVEEQIQLGIYPKKYLRYVDDFALFSDDLNFLKESRISIEQYLESLRLKVHPIKSQIFETKQGANFLGFRIFPTHIRVRSENLHRARNRLYKLRRAYQSNQVSLLQISQSLQSWFAHLNHGDTWRLRQKISIALAWATSESVCREGIDTI